MGAGGGRYQAPRATSAEEAAAIMAAVIKVEIGVDIEAKQLLKLFAARWQRMSALAHAIHKEQQR